ncbi:MAG: polysaccharide biosynthesis tyrosine autokinase [Aphanothece sp. CMT-3BRIN-NPC111]|jgi:capsular exopolysaccharide synthesis family protein|nr:polysaccharide biosynthesis tyrosine autokinase [Aphanothece sp. CMT-3BRIN-NPC111]
METGQHTKPLSLNGNGKQPQQLQLLNPAQLQETQEDDLNLRRVLGVLRRRALVIVGVAGVVATATVFWTLKQTPIYQSQFQVLVEPVTKEESQIDQLAQLAQSQGLGQSGLDYNTQIQVLRSPNLMSPIIKQIQARYPNFTYESLISNNLTITRQGDTKILTVAYRDPDPKKIKFVLDKIADGYIRYSVEERQSSLNKGIVFVEKQLPTLQDRVDKLQAQLQAFRQQNNLIDPESQAEQLYERFAGIEQQRLDAQVKLDEARSLYATLQNQLGLAPDQAIASASLSQAPQYQDLLKKLQDVETQIAIESSRFTEDSPTIQDLRDQQRNLGSLLGQEAQKVLGSNLSEAGVDEASPNSIRLSLTQQLVDTANQVQVLEVSVAAITQAEIFLNQKLRQLPLIARRYTDLQRELTVGTESLTRFLGVRESLQVQSAQNTTPWELIVKPEQPQQPIMPNRERNFLLGAIAGLLMGMGAALLLERLDNVFHSTEELKDSTRLPLLAVIPYNKQLKQMTSAAQMAALSSSEGSSAPKKSKGRKPRWYNASPFLEAFRSLQTNLSFLGSDTPIQSLVVSSTTPGDGKSTVSSNLAQAAAAMGQRVLLVDADMRRPQVHNVLGLENEIGLSNVISTEINPRDAMQQLPMWDSLYVLTAGQLPPDPTRLLSSKKMLSLMEQFKAEFDLVIYDTPPVLGLADGRILAVHTSGIVMVVALGKTDRSLLHQTLDLLKISSAPVLGVVANGVKNYTTTSYDYYQKYYNQASEVQQAAQKLHIKKRN